MADKYRLQYFINSKDVLAITWAESNGDCRVRALKESTNVAEHNTSHFQEQTYSDPMTLGEVRDYISANTELLGTLVHDCVGLHLEDLCADVQFKEPVSVRVLL